MFNIIFLPPMCALIVIAFIIVSMMKPKYDGENNLPCEYSRHIDDAEGIQEIVEDTELFSYWYSTLNEICLVDYDGKSYTAYATYETEKGELVAKAISTNSQTFYRKEKVKTLSESDKINACAEIIKGNYEYGDKILDYLVIEKGAIFDVTKSIGGGYTASDFNAQYMDWEDAWKQALMNAFCCNSVIANGNGRFKLSF